MGDDEKEPLATEEEADVDSAPEAQVVPEPQTDAPLDEPVGSEEEGA